MPRTLTPDDDLDRILIRLAREVMDSDTMIAALLAIDVAAKQGHGPALRRALDDVRALAGIGYLPDDDGAVIYRLCSTCQRVHQGPGCTETR